MEIVHITKVKKLDDMAEVKYLDRDKPNYIAPVKYLQQMIGFDRFILVA